ncbi:MAG TPA: M20 family metallopeptidase [Devosiaceae bacterium]|jgi:succinyl-diaminopimelate desuccinylase|nr:M20 family metallopeptidase [Devosiaceae bacterium]
MIDDAIALTRRLVQFDTRNPPGGEAECAGFVAGLLRDAGFRVELQEFGPGRVNVVARSGGGGPAAVFTGHLDTVPLGRAEWRFDPFGGEISNGRLYGRGSTDMKAGVAAMIVAAAAAIKEQPDGPPVALVLTGGEETGSDGARALVEAGLLGEARTLVVGEPTGNRFLAGHKGALWLRACAHGTAAHGSTPHLGDNAIYKAARAALRLEQFEFNTARHPVMGAPTLNVGTMAAGENVNSVPDRAELTVDIRTIPGMRHAAVTDQIGFTLGAETELDVLVDLPPVWSDPGLAEMRRLADAYRAASSREPEAASASYFTDASLLTPALGDVPTVICGPGDPAMAHKTDEYCEVAEIAAAVGIYRQMMVAS